MLARFCPNLTVQELKRRFRHGSRPSHGGLFPAKRPRSCRENGQFDNKAGACSVSGYLV